ncbi:MAG TPA: acyl-CoA dehydrogenase family protein [Dehalococcoidia bacterium]|nr:acyl-CoA dehydrogenase family protein [Dehalococcoidia bacterium]
MDWADTPEQAAFRAQVADMIENNLPQRYKKMAAEGESEQRGWQSDRVSEDPDAKKAAMDWASALGEKGWVAPHWPSEYGGAGLSSMEQFIYNQEMAQSGAPGVGGMGVQMLGPALIVHGSEEQKAEHLPKILSGEVAWCQGYSEPGAGSDLASLQTRAVRDGDEYVINGQKIWTSGAHTADFIFTMARTDPEAPKHRGISFFVFDKNLPGLTVRPLINMGWQHGFNETFFEDVHVPASAVVGEENRGWYVGATLLDFERSNISGAISSRRTITSLLDYIETDAGGDKAQMTESTRSAIADRYIETEVQFNFSLRIISMQAAGQIPNYEASTSKLFNSELNQALARTGISTFGLHGNLWDDESGRAPLNGRFTQSYVGSISSTIAGGTSEIQRNIIATRGLGLPRG